MKVESHRKVWIIQTLDKTSGRELLSGILEFLSNRHDWDLEIDIHPERITPRRVQELVSKNLNGILLSMPCPPKAMEAIAGSKVPVVSINVQNDSLATRQAPTRFVWTDNAAIGNAAAEHVLACGDFASYLFVGEGTSDWSEARGRGFKAFLQRAGLGERVTRTSIVRVPPPKADVSALRALLLNLPKPAAVFAAYDEIALGVIKSARAVKLKVPQQLIVVGADNTENIVGPESISSVRLAHSELGYKAASALHRLLQGHPAAAEPINIPPMNVISRRSTRFKSDQHTLSREIDAYLVHHAIENTCSAETIAAHFGLSRSSIEHRYRATTGRSLYQAILDARLTAAVSRIKRNPGEPLAAIARACGFSSATHLSHRLRDHLNRTSRQLRG